jgi:hypothetical protein
MLVYIIIIIIILLLFLILSNNKSICKKEHLTNLEKKYKLAIMAIFKNEQDYMQEWLDHHINQGVEHFYLYCNDPNLNKYPYLQSSHKKYEKYITLIPWVNKKNKGANTIQRQAYTHCVQTYNQEYQFIMMLDLDEFIIHTDKNKKVCDFIDSINDDWYRTMAIKVQRYDFGSNGHIKKPIGNLMDNYTKHEKICSSYKTIANSEYIDTNKNFYGVHDFYYLDKPGKVYNEYFTYKHTGFPNSCKKDNINEVPLVINHYYTKSYEEYLDRCKLWVNGGINTIGYRKDCEKTFKERDINDVQGY